MNNMNRKQTYLENSSLLSIFISTAFLFLLLFSVKTTAAGKSINDCSIALPYISIEYTSTQIKPLPKITDGSKKLTLNKDYTLSYGSNKLPGKGTVVITGKGSYSGCATRVFTITKKPINKCTITLNPPYFVYDGKPKKPIVKIKNGATELTMNLSYELSVQESSQVGIGTIYITGKGCYTGKTTVTFSIGPANVVVSSASVQDKSITVNWSGMKNIDGLYLYKYDSSSKSYKKIASIGKSQSSYVIKNLAPGTTYTYALRAYKKSSTGIIICSQNYSTVRKTTTMPPVSSASSPETSRNCIYLKWTKIPNASGYMIYNYNYGTGHFDPIKDVQWNTDSCVVKDLKSATRYPLAIKGYHKNGNSRVYSSKFIKVIATTKQSYEKKSLYVDGDSIAYGVGAGEYSYANALSKTYGFILTKKAIGGATLSNAAPECKHIVDSVKANVKKRYDYAILEGGINDYLRSIEIGHITSGTPDTKTVAGALESIFQHFRKNYPGTKLYFLIPHKIYDNGVAKRNIVNGKKANFGDVSKTKNLIGYTYISYYNMIKSVCAKYNVTVIDCYTKAGFDATISADRKAFTADSDGIHPTKNVQIYTYAPIAASVMGLK